MYRLLAMVFMLPLFYGCALFPSHVLWSECQEFNPEEIKNLAILVNDLTPNPEKAYEASVEQEFHSVLINKGYKITLRGEGLRLAMDQLGIQISDLMKEEENIELGKNIPAQGLVIVNILEFHLTTVQRKGEEKGTKVIKHYIEAKIDAKLRKMRTGEALWAGKYYVMQEVDEARLDSNILDSVARDVVKTCGPRSLWWYLFR